MRKNRIESVEEKVEEITRRIDNLTTQLFTSDSEYGLHQIRELKKLLENLTLRLSLNETEARIFSYVIQSLQRAVYPISEAYELEKMKDEIRSVRRKQRDRRMRNSE